MAGPTWTLRPQPPERRPDPPAEQPPAAQPPAGQAPAGQAPAGQAPPPIPFPVPPGQTPPPGQSVSMNGTQRLTPPGQPPLTKPAVNQAAPAPTPIRSMPERDRPMIAPEIRSAIPTVDPSRFKVPAAGGIMAPSLRAADLIAGYDGLLRRIQDRLIAEMDKTALAAATPERARVMIESAARSLITTEDPRILPQIRDAIVTMLSDEILGLGPIEPLYRDKSISEIMVNGPDKVYIEKDGKLTLVPIRFRDNTHILQVIDRIVTPIGRRIDESSPMVDARLPDGSRVNAIIPPLAPKSPSITIRKFRTDRMGFSDLVGIGSLSEGMATFLVASIKLRLNIIISGGTGSGKTTMLNALSEHIPDDERIVTIEDPAELQLRQDHVVTLEARPGGIEGRQPIGQRELVRNSLRMRPDRIIVGETRGGEAFDMLQAMNTGHDGSISTIHANNPRDAVSRIENMVLMAGMDLPARAIREQIVSAVHIIVQLNRFRDGKRRVTHVSEISGMEGETVTMQDIFLFQQRGVDNDGKVIGDWRPTGLRPRFVERFAQEGIVVPTELFTTSRW